MSSLGTKLLAQNTALVRYIGYGLSSDLERVNNQGDKVYFILYELTSGIAHCRVIYGDSEETNKIISSAIDKVYTVPKGEIQAVATQLLKEFVDYYKSCQIDDSELETFIAADVHYANRKKIWLRKADWHGRY